MVATKTHRIKSISEFHKLRGLPKPEHPLISLVDFSKIKRPTDSANINWILDFYQISLKQGLEGKIKYGQQQYDFNDGIMFFISPNQVFRIEPDYNPRAKREGWMLLIHPDFLWKTTLAKEIKNYEFFDYSVNEALFLSDKERKVVNSVVNNIKSEYHANIDAFTQNIIISQVETLLNYSERFYNRQFITRKISNHEVLTKVEIFLSGHFDNSALSVKGLPTVHKLAEAVHMSPKYLTRLLKVLTGDTAQQHIHNKLIEKAKEKLSTTRSTIGEISFDLGFEHSQSFSKLFKSKTKISPQEFRNSFSQN